MSAGDCTIDRIDMDGNKLEIDVKIRVPRLADRYELTFEREYVEKKLGVKWDDFVRSAHEVVEEICIQMEKEGHRDVQKVDE